MSSLANYRFEFRCYYMNRIWYYVHGDGNRYEVRFRFRVCDYERSISSYDDLGWEIEVLSLIHI